MKKQTLKSSILTVFLLILLVAALAISMVSCDKKGSETEAPETSAETTAVPAETEIGEGQTSFTFKVKFKDGSERTYLVKTNSTNVGTALQDVGLIAGEDGQYSYALGRADGADISATVKSMNAALQGRGGGRGGFAQGSAAAGKEEIESFFRAL